MSRRTTAVWQGTKPPKNSSFAIKVSPGRRSSSYCPLDNHVPNMWTPWSISFGPTSRRTRSVFKIPSCERPTTSPKASPMTFEISSVGTMMTCSESDSASLGRRSDSFRPFTVRTSSSQVHWAYTPPSPPTPWPRTPIRHRVDEEPHR